METKEEFLKSHALLRDMAQRILTPMLTLPLPREARNAVKDIKPGSITFTDDPKFEPKELIPVPEKELVMQTFCASHYRLMEIVHEDKKTDPA